MHGVYPRFDVFVRMVLSALAQVGVHEMLHDAGLGFEHVCDTSNAEVYIGTFVYQD